jgi:hypothetical protein
MEHLDSIIFMTSDGTVGIVNLCTYQIKFIQNNVPGIFSMAKLNNNMSIIYTLQASPSPFEFKEIHLKNEGAAAVKIAERLTGLTTTRNINAIVSFVLNNDRYLATTGNDRVISIWKKGQSRFEEVARFYCESQISGFRYHNFNGKPRIVCGGFDGRIYFLALENCGVI